MSQWFHFLKISDVLAHLCVSFFKGVKIYFVFLFSRNLKFEFPCWHLICNYKHENTSILKNCCIFVSYLINGIPSLTNTIFSFSLKTWEIFVLALCLQFIVEVSCKKGISETHCQYNYPQLWKFAVLRLHLNIIHYLYGLKQPCLERCCTFLRS